MQTEEQIIDAMKAPEREFLEENAKNDNVKVTDSGLQYRVIEQGTGTVSPESTSMVTVHYAGKLIDGTEFDSSYKRGEPASFPLDGVIPGWTEGLQLMHEGDKYEFFIPYTLGYGERGSGRSIPPFATLIFTVELISIGG
nr:FKBP-type peptidyl-prolyl cis-trans isomerase [Kordiimonas pumila]